MDGHLPTAVVTGGASGLGLALCRELQAQGFHTVILDLRAPPRSMLSSERSSYRWLDLQDTPTLLATLAEIHHSRGRIDWLVNCAGICVGGQLRDLGSGDFQRVMAVNFLAAVESTLAVLPLMRARGSGTVLNIASVAGLFPSPTLSPYSAAKAALANFSESIRVECRDEGIRVITVCPGFVDTPLFERAELRAVDRAALLQRLPLGRLPADEAARWILQGVARNRSPLVFPAYARLGLWLHRNLPGLYGLIVRKHIRLFQRSRLSPSDPGP